MPDTQSLAADAAATNDADGATPPAQAESSASQQTVTTPATPGKMGIEQAREILRQSQDSMESQRDPLNARAEVDPLDMQSNGDPLADLSTEEEPIGETPAEPETEQETPTKPAEEEQPPTETEQSTDTSEEVKGRKRVNIYRKNPEGEFLYSDRERAILQLSEERGIGLQAAERALYGDAPAPAGKPEPESTPEPPAVESLDAQIATLKTAKKDAAKLIDLEKVLEIDEQLEALREKRTEQLAKQSSHQAQARSQHEQLVQSSGAEAVALYGDAMKDGSALRAAIDADIARLRTANPAFFTNADWPLDLAARHAAKQGIAPVIAASKKAPAAEAKPAPKPAVPAAVAPKKPARPAPAPAPGTATVKTVSTPAFEAISAEIQAAKKRGDIAAIREANAKRERLFGSIA